MKRRHFMASLAEVAACTAAVPARERLARIGFLGSGAEKPNASWIVAFKQGLREQALVEGRDYVFDARWADGHYERFPALAAALVAQDMDVILVSTIAVARAAQRASTTTPIVMASINDPVGGGLIASLSRPGGNITGMASLTQDVISKVIELVHEALPAATSLMGLFNSANPSNLVDLEHLEGQARQISVTVRAVDFKTNAAPEQIWRAMEEGPVSALVIMADAAMIDFGDEIAGLALQRRIPVISTSPDITRAGGLLSYGVSRSANYRRSAYFVKKLLDGAKPADLPVEQPTGLVLSLNLKTARQLGIAIPDVLLVRADDVIE
jgi:putative ABC transport system substrate-binding protein